nr:phosphoglucosamine mutase [Bacteroidales bacterium]
MSLIKSISGIRGTIGGRPGEGLSPIDVVKFSSAFATFLLRGKADGAKLKMVVGRDARLSGAMVDRLVVGALVGMGVDVIETGLSTTPTTEMAVINHKADGGITIPAARNPTPRNAPRRLISPGG